MTLSEYARLGLGDNSHEGQRLVRLLFQMLRGCRNPLPLILKWVTGAQEVCLGKHPI